MNREIKGRTPRGWGLQLESTRQAVPGFLSSRSRRIIFWGFARLTDESLGLIPYSLSVPIKGFLLIQLFVTYASSSWYGGQRGYPPRSMLQSKKKRTHRAVSTTLWAGFRKRNLILFLTHFTFFGKRYWKLVHGVQTRKQWIFLWPAGNYVYLNKESKSITYIQCDPKILHVVSSMGMDYGLFLVSSLQKKKQYLFIINNMRQKINSKNKREVYLVKLQLGGQKGIEELRIEQEQMRKERGKELGSEKRKKKRRNGPLWWFDQQWLRTFVS